MKKIFKRAAIYLLVSGFAILAIYMIPNSNRPHAYLSNDYYFPGSILENKSHKSKVENFGFKHKVSLYANKIVVPEYTNNTGCTVLKLKELISDETAGTYRTIIYKTNTDRCCAYVAIHIRAGMLVAVSVDYIESETVYHWLYRSTPRDFLQLE